MGMIQDIAPHEFHNEWDPREPGEQDACFVFSKDRLLLSENGSRLPRIGELREAPSGQATARKNDVCYLFTIDTDAYFLWRGKAPVPPPGFCWESVRALRRFQDRTLAFAGMTARHLHTWYRENVYCGVCGAGRIHAKKERALVCPVCGHTAYPRIAPAVIAAVTDGDRLLMTRYAGRPYRGWALIAGFCEIGETAEDTVRREVMEEAGIRVKNIRYFGGQPWGIDADLLLGFFAEADGDTAIHLDREELSVGEWLRREEIPPQENTMSLTATMIEHFRRRGMDGIGARI